MPGDHLPWPSGKQAFVFIPAPRALVQKLLVWVSRWGWVLPGSCGSLRAEARRTGGGNLQALGPCPPAAPIKRYIKPCQASGCPPEPSGLKGMLFAD